MEYSTYINCINGNKKKACCPKGGGGFPDLDSRSN